MSIRDEVAAAIRRHGSDAPARILAIEIILSVDGPSVAATAEAVTLGDITTLIATTDPCHEGGADALAEAICDHFGWED